MILAGATVIIALAAVYAIGRHHGWMSAQEAWREQRALLSNADGETKE